MDADTAGGTEDLDVLARMGELEDRRKVPHSTDVLNRWVNQAQAAVGVEAAVLGWLVASSVVVAALQRALDEQGNSRFLLKGGTYLQHRMGWTGRPTKDVDGLVRGDLDDFFTVLDKSLREPWGPLMLTRSEVEVIRTPGKAIRPRRFYVSVSLRGDPWRRIKVEVSPDEAGAGNEQEILSAPDLKHFGLPSPDQLFGIALRYQIAQKLHACTDPHTDPHCANDRARDLVDLLLIRDLVAKEGAPSLAELREAAQAVFTARAREHEELGLPSRPWPPDVVAHGHWDGDYADAAGKAAVPLSLADAVVEVAAWVQQMDVSGLT